MLVLVSPFTKSFDDIWFTYIVPDELKKYIKPGIVLDVPLQNKIESGVVLDIQEENKLNFDLEKLKPIASIKYEIPLLSLNQIKLVRWISKYYFCKIHTVLNLFFPRLLRDKIDKIKLDLTSNNSFNYEYNNKKTLTKNQDLAYNEILKTDKDVLLYGVTWSGKTEIYMDLVKHYLDLWKQCLVLVPEIVLNNQIFDRFKEIFWQDVIIINSSITDTKKYKNWIDIYNNNAKIIIWTRSSLFYPYCNLWLVIVDEEHDLSYKSDSNPRIDIREIIEYISTYIDIKVVYASGTPSIKTIYKWVKWDYKLINLLDEYKN